MLGTYVGVTVRNLEPSEVNPAIDAAFEAFGEVDRLLSSHRTDSELNAINTNAGRSAIRVSRWTYECIEASVQASRQSNGAFDITCRPLLELWGFVQKRNYHIPSHEELATARHLVGYENIILLKNKISSRNINSQSAIEYRVGLKEKGMQIDVGAIGKGFAVDKAIEALTEHGVKSGLVRAGGDLRVFGPEWWEIGIANPEQPQRSVKNFKIKNEAVSTSGNYENFFVLNGKRYAHILDPRTGWPVERRRSVSVRAPQCMWSDAWSTILFIEPNSEHPSSIQLIDLR